ncbi:MAG TPA: PHB depolymerase family esterase [Casimicrobiaceae bacterium]|nr:PHB depolymerase family esterase [Casimicrobiaceae bacterium]
MPSPESREGRVAQQSWWRGWLERVRGLLHPPAAAGRWVDGHAFSLHGLVGFRPWVFPRRRYRLYLPKGWSRAKAAPLVALIHGCRQSAEDFARGTRIEDAADRTGVVVLMPHQKDGANPWRCWNWFDRRTADGRGEAAIVAAMVRKVAGKHGIDRERIVAAGMSSGAALAAAIGLHHPALVRGVFAHSGIACGAAASAFTALTVMRRGPETDVAAIARTARAAATGAPPVALFVVQGGDDDTVSKLHADALARQYLAFNGLDVPPGANTTLPEPAATARDMPAPDRLVRTREWQRDGLTLVRVVDVAGVGHAWSGGDASLPFHAPGPPDATALLVDWAVAPGR